MEFLYIGEQVEKINKYWAERAARVQAALTKKNVKQTEAQLVKYYTQAMDNCIASFEDTYYKLQKAVGSGKEPTPADLYKLDKYWQMRREVEAELERLGYRQHRFLNQMFVEQYEDIWDLLALPSQKHYSKLDKKAVSQLVNQIWCADGVSWSQRIWKNTEALKQALNDGLISIVATGKQPRDLKKHLQTAFGVSFNRADSLVRTELAHIQTQAATDRYKSYGMQEVEILADEDERRCEVCGKLHEKRYPINATVPIPAHPKCRCCVIPVVDDEED